MSNRSLIELNHDYAHRIVANSEEFLALLQEYLASGAVHEPYKLERLGVRVIGMKHHSEPHNIAWGYHKEEVT